MDAIVPVRKLTALQVAIEYRNKEAVEMLLKAKAYPNLKVPKYGSAFDAARKVALEFLPLPESYHPEVITKKSKGKNKRKNVNKSMPNRS